MSSQSDFETLKAFFATRPACHEAMKQLKHNTEIRLWMGERGQNEGALYFDGQQAQLESRPARNPDVEFTLLPNAVKELENHPGEDLGRLGVSVLRLLAQGSIKVRVCGSVLGVLRNGYLSIIKAAGPEFAQFLAQYGFSSAAKIVSLIRGLKR